MVPDASRGRTHTPRATRVARFAPVLLAGFASVITACGDAADTGSAATAGDTPASPPTFSEGKPPRPEPPENPVGGFTIELPAMTLEPGEEGWDCWLFPLEVEGPSRIVGGAVLTVQPGMHHGNITTRKKTGEGVRPCDGDDGPFAEAGDILEGGAVLFASSTQISGEEWQSFPPGVGFRVKEGYEIIARMHYLNTSSEPITVAPRYEWFTIDEASVVHEVGPFAWTLKGFEIPPQAEITVESDCRIPAPMQIVNVLPHMHALGRAFTASFLGGPLDGQAFLASKGYDPDSGVMVQYDPAIDLSQGEGASFGCTWRNTFDKVIVEGVGDNEMCILFGYAYPPANAYSALGTAGGCVAVAPPAE